MTMTPRWRRALALLVAIAAVGGCTSSPTIGAKGTVPTTGGAGADDGTMALLFVQTAVAGTLTAAGGAGEYDLVLTGVAPRTTWFSDRPVRRTGAQPTETITNDWRAFGFTDDPPNAALELHDRAATENTVVLELREPRYDTTTRRLRYRVTVLDEQAAGGDAVRRGGLVHEVPDAFTSASLFIDDASVSATVLDSGMVTGGSATTGTTMGTTTGTAPAAGGSTVGLCTFPGAIPMPTVSPTGGPDIDTQGPGTIGAASSSPTLAAAFEQFNTLRCTHYAHQYSETPATGIYYYDCVGFTGYSVRTATPTAWQSVVTATGLRPGYVPTPQLFQEFFASMLTSAPPAGWAAVPTATAIQPGDVLAWIANQTTEAGHSVMALSTPVPIPASTATDKPLAAGESTYALIIMDSTATTHGPLDTRRTDNPLSQRNAPLGSDAEFDGAPDPISAGSPDAPSGLGIGTIGLVANASGQVTGIIWSLGTAIEPVPFGAGRPLN